MVEPWLRGTLTEVEPVKRQVLHALQLAGEDIERWCAQLSAEQMNARPGGIASVAFHLRHIARSLDRLLTYIEGRQLSLQQFSALQSELETSIDPAGVLAELRDGLAVATLRIREIAPDTYNQVRVVGRQSLPTTLGGLMVHCAEHTQRHVGQAVTTAQIVTGAKR